MSAPALAPAPGRSVSPSLAWRLGPIVFFQVYLNASLAVFAFGPWDWPVRSPEKLYTFVLVAHLALLAGYLTGAFGRPRRYHGRIQLGTWTKVSVATTLVLFVPTLMAATGGGVNPLLALTDPAAVYMQFQLLESDELRGTAPITYVRFLLGPVLALAIPLVARMWRSMSRPERILGVAAVLANLSLFVFSGRNKGLVDLILLLPWLMAIGGFHLPRRVAWRRVLVGGALLVAVVIGFFEFYTRNTVGRFGGRDDLAFTWNPLFGGIEANVDKPIVRDLPPMIRNVYLLLSFSQTHGYVALSWALDKPFEPSWGVGHSYFLQTLERRFTGRTELQEHSYPYRLETEDGWNMSNFWHTSYTWFASDLTFPGTILLVFLIGRLFALVWLDSLRGDNPYALGLLVLVLTMLYYLPTNNIVLGFPEAMAAFWGLLGLWLLTRWKVRVSARGTPVAAALAPPARAELADAARSG